VQRWNVPRRSCSGGAFSVSGVAVWQGWWTGEIVHERLGLVARRHDPCGLANHARCHLIYGGFIVLTLLGGVAGKVSYSVFGPSVDKLYWRTVGCALVVDVVIALVLALAADVLAPHLTFSS
jgi:hypothetical protein